MKLQIAICDDDKMALEYEVEMLRTVLEEKQVEYSIDIFDSPRSLMQSYSVYNIVVLDVEMEGMNGIETAEKIRARSRGCLIFFVTNHEAYLDEALNQRAFRFWTKPLDKRKLSYGIDSAINEMKSAERFISITVNDEKIELPIRNIIYIYTQNKELHIVTARGEIVSDDTFESTSLKLKENECFFEPHRSYCVNLNYVRDYEKNKIFCAHGTKVYEVYLSRRKYGAFRKRFLEWLGGK